MDNAVTYPIVEIDPSSGFCSGVVGAIERAEENLQRGPLFCIGDIVHNRREVERLEQCGLKTIDHETFASLPSGSTVLFRAHGEPPESYQLAEAHGLTIIDASCPVVLSLQKRIQEAAAKMALCKGLVVIYGKRGHAEVNGLIGRCPTAVVIETPDEIEALERTCRIVLFSQTTMSLTGFQQIVEAVNRHFTAPVEIYDTICRKVSNRVPALRLFAAAHDVLFLVSGHKSSNGRQLYNECLAVNPHSYWIEGASDLTAEMTKGAKTIGITGATSTPQWVLEEVYEALAKKDTPQ